jgi:hypothetical protein
VLKLQAISPRDEMAMIPPSPWMAVRSRWITWSAAGLKGEAAMLDERAYAARHRQADEELARARGETAQDLLSA